MRFGAELQMIDGAIPATGVDIHKHGALVLSPEPWQQGAILFLVLKDFQLGGFAEVRHCTRRKDGRYAIGLAFRGPLAPQGAAWQIQRFPHGEQPWTRRDDHLPKRPREVA